jgi:hypothetical protein
MSMPHKAFEFDHAGFESELAPVLRSALETGETGGLVEFINANLPQLMHPFDQRVLDASWEDGVDPRDAHGYGEYALTKYYDPLADFGLDCEWQFVDEILEKELGDSVPSPVLGEAFGPETNYFDPGKIGSFFQSAAQVKQSLETVASMSEARPELREQLALALAMLNRARATGIGLYVTF